MNYPRSDASADMNDDRQLGSLGLIANGPSCFREPIDRCARTGSDGAVSPGWMQGWILKVRP